MFKKLATAFLRKALTLGAIVAVILVIGYCNEDRTEYPGKADFKKADDLIDTNNAGIAHGNSEDAKQVGTKFATTMKTLQAAFFTGGTKMTLASGGEFVTYCQHNPDSVAIMVHVPGLRKYKDDKAREAIAQLAWSAGNQAAKELKFSTETPAIIVGLRGIGSYGPIWSGKLGGEPEIKTDKLAEVRRIYPFFIPSSTAK